MFFYTNILSILECSIFTCIIFAWNAKYEDIWNVFIKGFKKFVLNAEVAYSYNKDAIVPVLQSDDTNIIETFGNLDNAQNMKASLLLQWYPFSNNILRLRLYSEVFHQINAFGNEKWNHTGHSFIPSINLAYKKWGVSVFYQTEKKSLVGQTMKTIPSMASV